MITVEEKRAVKPDELVFSSVDNVIASVDGNSISIKLIVIITKSIA